MKLPGRAMVFRLGGVMLFVLALLPFTAPFSTCTISDLLGGTPSDGAILQSKPAPDEPTLALSGRVGFQGWRSPISRRWVSVIRHLRPVDIFQVPLRI